MRALLSILAVLLLQGCAFRHLYLEPLPPEASELKARTADGWEIALIHYRPSGPPKGPPVLLCHGISANYRNMDLDADHSLARWFAANGREAFAMSLRGTGSSDHPDPAQGRAFEYSLDTFAEQDLPAAIAKVKEVTGARKVQYVGHSMGGLIAYVYLAKGGRELDAVVTLGSPARFVWGGMLEQFVRDWGPLALEDVDSVPMAELAALVLPIQGEFEGPVELMMYNPRNVNKAIWKKLIANGLGTISGDVLRQFTLWFERDTMVSADGATDYAPALRAVRTPVFVVAGKYDRLAPVPSVKAAYDWLGGPKAFFIAGEANGLKADYGHMDMVIGERAPVELWPRLLEFLDAPRAGIEAAPIAVR